MENRDRGKEYFERMPLKELELSRDEQFAVDLAVKVAEAVLPVSGVKQKDVPVSKRSHDFNYALDEIAEEIIRKEFVKSWQIAETTGLSEVNAYITEDQGWVNPPDLKGKKIGTRFMIDPVDGTRPLLSGTEQACVTIAGTDGENEEAEFKDIKFGVTHFIKEGITYFVRRGEGVWKKEGDGKFEKVESRENLSLNLKDCSTTTESYSFNMKYTGIVHDPLMRAMQYQISAPSGSWSVGSLVRGHNEVQVDVRDRIARDYPNHPDIKYDPVKSKGGYPMDVAASVLMIQELGGKVTDAYGNDISPFPLWSFDNEGNWNSGNQLSLVSAITPELHLQALDKIQEGFRNLEEELRAA